MMMHQVVAFAIATFGYLGHVPFASGTVASMVTCLVLFFLPSMSLVATLTIDLMLFCLSAWSAKVTATTMHEKDPSCIVIDEVLGMCVAVIGLPKVWWLYLIALVLFRFFDIAKPFPINALERVHYKNLGIVLDDALAGLLTCILINIAFVVFSI